MAKKLTEAQSNYVFENAYIVCECYSYWYLPFQVASASHQMSLHTLQCNSVTPHCCVPVLHLNLAAMILKELISLGAILQILAIGNSHAVSSGMISAT